MSVVEHLRNRTIVVSYGMGVDSLAMLIQMKRLGVRPTAVVFADVGSEKKVTYDYVPIACGWLEQVGFPALTTVKYEPKTAPYDTIEGNMVMNATLPGATFNMGSCTMKFKIEPQLKWARHNPDCQAAWARGEKIAKLIGFEAGEEYREKRADTKAHAGRGTGEQEKYEWFYPLMEWGWDRQRCIDEIRAEGLPVPPKSACLMCPNQKPHEVDELTDEERARVIRVELTAEPYNRKVHGLWRRPKKDGRPGSITQYILERDLPFMPLDELERIDPMPLNPNCGKAKNGTTFDGPHDAPRLADLLRDHAAKAMEKETEQHIAVSASF